MDPKYEEKTKIAQMNTLYALGCWPLIGLVASGSAAAQLIEADSPISITKPGTQTCLHNLKRDPQTDIVLDYQGGERGNNSQLDQQAQH